MLLQSTIKRGKDLKNEMEIIKSYQLELNKAQDVSEIMDRL